jgi:hypothetical protein
MEQAASIGEISICLVEMFVQRAADALRDAAAAMSPIIGQFALNRSITSLAAVRVMTTVACRLWLPSQKSNSTTFLVAS